VKFVHAFKRRETIFLIALRKKLVINFSSTIKRQTIFLTGKLQGKDLF
jgi:hypothetical protein